jgi:TfoX/Sxy family transcriptional regulator of competence genes
MSMAYSERLASRIREILSEGGEVEERKMFGGLAFMVDGHMCCGVTGDDVMLRLGPDQAQQALEEPDVRPMDFTGRTMKGYVYVGTPGVRTEAKLRRWLQLARDFVDTLPAK